MRFSIIIPVYNSEAYLNKTLDSVCLQDFSDFEVICINDGSTDNSLNILLEYADKYHNIVIYNQQNAGPSIARNKGIEIANGEYILFVDSDDWLERSTILSELDNYIGMHKQTIDIVYFPGNTNWGGNATPSPNYEQKKYSSGWELASDNCLKGSYLFFGAIYAYVYRLDLIRQYQVQFNHNIIYGEDRLWVFDILDKATTSIVYSKPCYFYNVRQNSLMTDGRPNKKRDEDAIKVAELLWSNKYTHKKTLHIKKYIAKFYLSSIRNFLNNGYKPKIKFKIALMYSITSTRQFLKLLVLYLSPQLYKSLFP